ncbi:uncharacterized protein LOC113522464 [Galleria mellonella]|uniref:Uncharacterized protein LOC113522464 n=1 Tax=Galleria mellonella TaxID=7137 RepID=A0A6J1X8N6_GALME|nr:uncharacterized protein LOC113522464 [Galleria mellonella]
MMTTDVEGLKTNEFLRRRKLRLQQVREQSKDIAKKIRQRTKTEKLQNITDIDRKRQKEYFQRQDKLVKKLEHLYAKGIKSVGTSHKNATEVTLLESPEKIDLSKQRGREAVAELRRKKQEKLDEQQKLLSRKVHAREIANEISREKSNAVVNKLLTKPSINTDETNKETNPSVTAEPTIGNDTVKASKEDLTRIDMGTQWDFDVVPNEWEPNIPTLSLPRDDRDSTKDSVNNNMENKSDKSKRLDLFALSEEMPLSLRGGLANIPEERVSVKPSLTLVSEYLKNRGLNLRDTDSGPLKKPSSDLNSIKQTIIRTRASNTGAKGKITEKTATTSSIPSTLAKKNSVTVYNHSTRDMRDIPRGDDELVVPTYQTGEDAYSQAVKETSNEDDKVKEHQKRLQDMRSKIAMTKQNVEKEYNDTISFLNSLPKDKASQPNKVAYMDGRRQQMLNKCKQQKLQHEFKKIEKECRKQSNMDSSSQPPEREKITSKSPSGRGDSFEDRDFQYSWMPVPESDGNLVIHTIPTSVKEGKPGNTVKFSKVDSYHEYRSRHKHTPPTKDTVGQEKQKKVLETVFIENNSDSTDCSSISSDTSSIQNLRLNTTDSKNKNDTDPTLTDTERIVIYKILKSKKKERAKKKEKLITDIAKSLSSLNKNMNLKATKEDKDDDSKEKTTLTSKEPEKENSLDHLQEGVYKTTSEKGDNMTSLYFTDNAQGTTLTEDGVRKGRPCRCGKQLTTDEHRDQESGLQEVGVQQQFSSKSSNICADCKCGSVTSTKCVDNQSTIQPSAATSSSSFKTAAVDKTTAALPDGGFIKLVDDDGQETGKFYIGATGFLKDDAYEVIIQLRKKESMKEDNIKSGAKLTGEKTLLPTQDIQQNDENLRTTTSDIIGDKQKIVNDKCSDNLIDVNATTTSNVKLKKVPENDPKNEEVNKKESQTQIEDSSEEHIISQVSSDPHTEKNYYSNKYCDKGVYTSFQMSYTAPSHVSKLDSDPKPATSACTQTTFSSPNPRPVFIHMSSSTSTAYMSPPEMVLPKFFGHHKDNMYDSESPDEPNIRKEQVYNDESKSCCKHCTHSRKHMRMKDHFHCAAKRKCFKNKLHTPPNTFRSCSLSENKDDISDDKHSHIKKHNCYKCKTQTQSKTCAKSANRKNLKHIAPNLQSSQNLVMHVSSTASSYKNIISNHALKRDSRSNLNPIIKNYVNKLLTLNKEGMKAIEVVNQECSAVTTPGSSIIDMPHNVDGRKPLMENKISLEQIKSSLIQQILNEHGSQIESKNKTSINTINHNMKYKKKACSRISKKRSVHKVKSLNISRNLLRNNKNQPEASDKLYILGSQSIPNRKTHLHKESKDTNSIKTHIDSQSTPSSKQLKNTSKAEQRNVISEKTDIGFINLSKVRDKDNVQKDNKISQKGENNLFIDSFPIPSPKTVTYPANSEIIETPYQSQTQPPMNISTQANRDVDTETNFMKLAENKLHNIEKIADLTEKCTQRLSNLAKVLEEVRKNKSTAYSQVSSSDSASDSDQKLNKKCNMDSEPFHMQTYEPIVEIQNDLENDTPTRNLSSNEGSVAVSDSTKFIPFLIDIPKPAASKYTITPPVTNLDLPIIEEQNIKTRGRPPPALTRINLKHGQEYITPHELSTVVEVDSPMSVKFKNLSSRNNTKCDVEIVESNKEALKNDDDDMQANEKTSNPDVLLQTDENAFKCAHKLSFTDTSDDYKIKMMDLKQFNDIMLKPFISIHEYAKQYNIGSLDDASNIDDIPKDEGLNDELSSMHSDGSLPDVIAELLKRKIISEPFRFDSGSNVNSSTVSSESTSVFALSKMRKEKKKSKVVIQDKENVVETSDTLSFSSNPDLENAFKKLGMGWASSTLKKTKERLALSSSSNTSSSSLSQFKLKSFTHQDIPALVTDSVSSILNVSKKPLQGQLAKEKNKNAGQQTSLTQSMTVKEFLANELANKITFTNKSIRNETEEFVSLFETKMPEELKHSSHMVHEEHSVDSEHNGNRARTSTPVQIFKSMTYHSSSSSNLSNGLFSNVDDLSSVKVTSNSIRNPSTSEKDDLTIPNCSLRTKKDLSDASKSD